MRRVVIILSKSQFYISGFIILLCIVSIVYFIAQDAFLHDNTLKGKIIVVDAGHGGVDSGANNRYILEKDVNLEVALKLRKRLQDRGASVIMTRTEDISLSKSKKFNRDRYMEDLNARVNIINNSSAHMFVSIHTNSSKGNTSTRGAMVFYNSSHSHNRDMAYIFQYIFNSFEFQYRGISYKSNHIPQRGKYYLLTNAKIPGIIVETGFITNGTDLMLLKKTEYREYLAGAICQGIVKYFLSIDQLPQKMDEEIYIKEENTIDMAEEDTCQ